MGKGYQIPIKEQIESIIVSAQQMQQIEAKIFADGMPVAALMEKAARLCSDRLQSLYPLSQVTTVGILVGPGHNGGDALVIARELYLAGYKVMIYRPFTQLKPLTANHADYASSLGITIYDEIQPLQECQLIVDGLFGFGLTRNLTEELITVVNLVNSWWQPIISIDLPSGIDTDTGNVLGGAIKATHTFCLGLWKRAFFQDSALEYLGTSERIDFGITPHQIWSVLPQVAPVKQITTAIARKFLPLPRPLVTYKYRQGHLLLICGSHRYAGAAILTALGARASGIGMLSIAVPQSLKTLLISHLPEALVIDCPETSTGAIAEIPFSLADLTQFDVIAMGSGLTIDANPVVADVLKSDCPLILDADGLNILADLGTLECLSIRTAPTILTPHWGEFKRLFPTINLKADRLSLVQQAAQTSNSLILLKGARTAIADSDGLIWVVPDSTPALARGGSGDVLTGLTGGLVAQAVQKADTNLLNTVATAAWWHAQAGIMAAQQRSELGVDATTLAQYLNQIELN